MATKQFTLPMFPLNMLLLPGETTKLYIYEERYKQLVNDCLANQASFGIPFLEKGLINDFGSVQNQFIDYDTVAGLNVYNVASSLQLTNTEKYRLISSTNQQLHLLNQIKFINHIINTETQIKDRFIEN